VQRSDRSAEAGCKVQKTSVHSIDVAVADRVAEWVHGLLASAAPGDTAIAAPAGD
jgi:hypothetical protein